MKKLLFAFLCIFMGVSIASAQKVDLNANLKAP